MRRQVRSHQQCRGGHAFTSDQTNFDAGLAHTIGYHRSNAALDEIDLIELNEAFAAQALAVAKELGFDRERLNPNGSGIALGHPVGATGTILTVKAAYELKRTGGRYALITMCIGGGQGIAAVFERV